MNPISRASSASSSHSNKAAWPGRCRARDVIRGLAAPHETRSASRTADGAARVDRRRRVDDVESPRTRPRAEHQVVQSWRVEVDHASGGGPGHDRRVSPGDHATPARRRTFTRGDRGRPASAPSRVQERTQERFEVVGDDADVLDAFDHALRPSILDIGTSLLRAGDAPTPLRGTGRTQVSERARQACSIPVRPAATEVAPRPRRNPFSATPRGAGRNEAARSELAWRRGTLVKDSFGDEAATLRRTLANKVAPPPPRVRTSSHRQSGPRRLQRGVAASSPSGLLPVTDQAEGAASACRLASQPGGLGCKMAANPRKWHL